MLSIFENLGASVDWDSIMHSATITLGETIIKVYEELPEVQDVIAAGNSSYLVIPRVVPNGGNQTIYFETVIRDDEGSPIAGEYVSIFISSGPEDRNDYVVYDSNITDQNRKISLATNINIH